MDRQTIVHDMGRRIARVGMARAIVAALLGRTATLPDEHAWTQLRKGDLAGAEQAASDLLRRANAGDKDWEPGDLRHRAHTVLGFVALARNDLDRAEAELRRSAEVEPSGVLASFGPDLGLLWELLTRGRGGAAEYFAQRFNVFWPGPGRNAVDDPGYG